MNKCDYYDEQTKIIGWLGPDEIIRKTVYVCNGTREQDVCSCGGDRTKCDFYPEVRQKENKPMKAKIVVEGKEFPIEILDPELEKLIKPQKKKTGYERVEDGEYYYCQYVNSDNETMRSEERGIKFDDALYNAADYYSSEIVAKNNARADKLMRQLRRFAVEHREKELNWLNEDQKKYTISFDYDKNMLSTDFWCSSGEFGTMYFDSERPLNLPSKPSETNFFGTLPSTKTACEA